MGREWGKEDRLICGRRSRGSFPLLGYCVHRLILSSWTGNGDAINDPPTRYVRAHDGERRI